MRRLLFVFVATAALVCACDPEPKEVPVTSVDLNLSSLEMTEGDSEMLTATVSPSNATDKTVTWSSTNTAVATVTNGQVQAVAPGSSNITAKAGGKSASCYVLVKAKVIPVTSVTLDKTSLTLTEGDSQTLNATVNPDNATDKTVTWTSSDTKVATVTDKGVVTAVAPGSATITAKAGDKSATCAVTVNAKVIPVTSVTLDKTSLTLTEGDSQTLTATVEPDDATDKTVTWTSSDTKVATVTDKGVVTAVAKGSATITAKAGEKSASCAVTVNAKVIPVTSVTLDKTSLTLTEGDSQTLTATVKPDDATDKTVTWISSDSKVATVSVKGVVTAVAKGSATITAKAGEKSATCAVTVNAKNIPVSSISWDPSYNESKLRIGETQTYMIIINPSNATDRTVTWKSSNTNIIRIKGQGTTTPYANVEGVASGSATLSATCGGKTISRTITVMPRVTNVYILDNIQNPDWNYIGQSDMGLHLTQDETYKLTTQVNLAYDTDKPADLKWTSENTAYVTVSGGVVTAKKAYVSGDVVKPVKVWVSSVEEPSVKTSIDVYVHSVPTGITLINDAIGWRSLKPGESTTLNYSVKPSTAKQLLAVSSVPNSVCGSWTVTMSGNTSIRVTAPAWKSGYNSVRFYVDDQYKIGLKTIGTKNVISSETEVFVCQWKEGDVKPLDYVYYNSNTGKLRTSDGGLRALVSYGGNKRFHMRAVQPSPQSYETVIAIVTFVGSKSDITSYDTYASESGMLKGISNDSGKHGFAIALEDAPLSGSYPMKWSDDKDDVDSASDWVGTYNTHINDYKSGAWRNAFSLTILAGYYNKKRGDSHEIKPMNALIEYGKTHPAPSLGLSTPDRYNGYNYIWILPTAAMCTFNNADGSEFRWDSTETLWASLLNVNLGNVGGTTFGSSWPWSINTYDKSNAYHVGGGYANKTSKYHLRPWLIF